jgi:RNA polymerase sigma factor (sigma-70 family)
MANAQLGAALRKLRGMVRAQADEETSDRELLARYVAGREEAAFVALLRRHGPMVLGVCRRAGGNLHDAEDAFQATFLVLARQAASIRNQESVASWLHGVARRLALVARGRGDRRQARERRAADMRRTSGASDKAWQELQATLDEALRQVPAAYRAPLLLCYLQGKTQEEAARDLGCPLGTVRSRLARGRERLKRALERQGVRLSAAALAAALAGSSAAAALPAALLRATARAGLAYAAGQAPAGLVSAQAAELLKGGPPAAATGKVKVATAVVLAVGALGLGAGAARQLTQPVRGAPAAANRLRELPGSEAPRPAATDRKDRNEVTLSGRVLGVDGKPLAGAKLLLLGQGDKPAGLGASGADGRFTVALPHNRVGLYLLAQAPGAGVDFLGLERYKPGDPVELRLVKDRPVRGRVVDTEGKPVAGVRVQAVSLNVYADNSLDSFLVAWKKRHFMSGIPTGVKHLYREESGLFATKTDEQGRFTVRGVGDERLVSLRLSGGGIADAELWVVNRAGFDPRPYNQASADNVPRGLERLGPGWLLYGPDLSLVAEAEKPIRGTVTAADTGKPRPGVTVWLTRNGSDLAPIIVSAKTDAQGRYELRGARKASAYMVELKGDPADGYMACQARAADTPGYQPVTLDVRVARGVVVSGRVLDRSTGKPVPGFAMAAVLSGNSFVKDYPEFDASAWVGTEQTGDDGTFRVVTIPGPVLLMGGPDARRAADYWQTVHARYKPVKPDPDHPKYFSKQGGYYTPGGGRSLLQGNFCKVLEIKPGTRLVKQDVLLEPAAALPVRIEDGDGRPVAGALVTGVGPENWHYPITAESASCMAYHLEGKPRLMVFFAPKRKLAGALRLKGDEKGPVVAKLGPPGSVKGRLLGEDGKPLAGVEVRLHFREREAEEVHAAAHRAKLAVSDADGRFAIDDVLPGLKFELSFGTERRKFERATKPASPSEVQSGEVKDLGEIKVKRARERDAE